MLVILSQSPRPVSPEQGFDTALLGAKGPCDYVARILLPKYQQPPGPAE